MRSRYTLADSCSLCEKILNNLPNCHDEIFGEQL